MSQEHGIRFNDKSIRIEKSAHVRAGCRNSHTPNQPLEPRFKKRREKKGASTKKNEAEELGKGVERKNIHK